MARWSALAAVVPALLVASCGADAAPAPEVNWAPFQPAPGAIDLAGPRSDGRLVAGVGGGLQLFGRGAQSGLPAARAGPGSLPRSRA